MEKWKLNVSRWDGFENRKYNQTDFRTAGREIQLSRPFHDPYCQSNLPPATQLQFRLMMWAGDAYMLIAGRGIQDNLIAVIIAHDAFMLIGG